MNYIELFESNVKGLQERSNGQVIGHCPFHDDRNISWSGNIETGLWFCHAGCGSGNAYQFAERLGIDSKTYITVNNISKKKSRQERKTQDKPISIVDLTKKAHIYHKYLIEHYSELPIPKSWSKGLIIELNIGWDYRSKSFTFPLYNAEGEIIGIHWHRGKSSGDGSCKWYPLHFISRYDNNKPLILDEGEKDCISMLSLGHQVITATLGANNIPKDLSHLKPFKEIIILYDNGKAGIDGSQKLANHLKTCFSKTKIRIGKWKNEIEGYDVTDSITNDPSLEELDKIIRNAEEYHTPRKGFTIMTADKLIGSNFKPPVPIIDQILYENGIGLIAGTDGVGKSLLALQAACSIALGVPFLDYFDVPKPKRVLLIQFELENGDLSQRFEKQQYWFNKNYSKHINNWLNLQMSIIEQDTEIFIDQWDKIEDTLIENIFSNSVLIIDNLYTSTNIDVSNNADLPVLLSRISEIKRKYELTIILITHHIKGTHKEKILSKDMIRGGKMMTDFATNVFQMADSTFSTELRIGKITKLRSGNSDLRNIAFKLRLDPKHLIFHKGGIITREELHFIDPKERNEIKALKAIKPYTKNDKCFDRQQFVPCVEELGYTSPKTVDNFLRKLNSWGLIKKIKYNCYQIITTELRELDSDNEG